MNTRSPVFSRLFSDLGLVREGRRAHGLSVVLSLEVLNAFDLICDNSMIYDGHAQKGFA